MNASPPTTYEPSSSSPQLSVAQMMTPPGQVYPLDLPKQEEAQQPLSVQSPLYQPYSPEGSPPFPQPVIMPAQSLPVATVPLQGITPLIQTQPMILHPQTQTSSNSPEFSDWLKMTDKEKDEADLRKNDITEEDEADLRKNDITEEDETSGEKKGGTIKSVSYTHLTLPTICSV